MPEIFKIVTDKEYSSFDPSTEYCGSALDKQDGFIHLSSFDQLDEIVRLWFKDSSARLWVLHWQVDDDDELCERLPGVIAGCEGNCFHYHGVLKPATFKSANPYKS